MTYDLEEILEESSNNYYIYGLQNMSLLNPRSVSCRETCPVWIHGNKAM